MKTSGLRFYFHSRPGVREVPLGRTEKVQDHRGRQGTEHRRREIRDGHRSPPELESPTQGRETRMIRSENIPVDSNLSPGWSIGSS